MQSRRSFLGTVSLPAAAAAAGMSFRPTELRAEAIDIAMNLASHPGGPMDVVDDENFWREVQGAFTVDRTLMNLNNGGVSPAPKLVQDAMKRHQDYSNLAPTYTMWQILEPQREGTRQRM
ncbi:MAG: aminotransferase, partial [Longimicrobiales bacterium]